MENNMVDASSNPTTEITPKPPRNFMWVLCDTTVKSQLSEGALLAVNSLLGNALAKAMQNITKSFLQGDGNDPSTTTDSDQLKKDLDEHPSLDWLVREMALLASQASSSKTDQKLGMEMTDIQLNYSEKNTQMQTSTNVLNEGTQSESQQAQQDNTNLQSLVTLASTGSGAATYAANLMQQTMA